MRALIVDDSRFVRTHLRGLLQERGIESEEAANGQTALDLLHSGLKVDFVLVDWSTPVVNGLEMVKRMRREGFSRVKVMMVTTESESEFVVLALNAGADAYLMEPFDGQSLGEKLAMLGLVEA